MADTKLPTSAVNVLGKGSTGALSATATGAIVPLVYGRTRVTGYIYAWEITTGTPDVLTVGVAWCLGEAQVENVFINDAVIPSTGVEVVHYPGRDDQPVDAWMTTAKGTYTDDLVFSLPAGDVGVCHSVFKIEAGALDNAPRFSAIVTGRPTEGLYDTGVGSLAAPYTDYTVVMVTLWSTGSYQDESKYGRTITLGNGATVSDITNYVNFDGNDSYATWTQSSEFDLGAGNWCIEATVRTEAAAPSGNRILINCNGGAGNRCMIVYQVSGGLGLAVLVYSDGTNTLAGGTFYTMTNNTDFDLCVERCGPFMNCYIDGVLQQQYYVGSASIYYPSGTDWYLGSFGGTAGSGWDGRLQQFRFTVGKYRYGADYDHLSSNQTSYYYYDQLAVAGGTKEYSDNPALAWADLATDDIIGMGATIDTDYRRQARDWCDDLGLNGGTVKRAQTGLVVTTARRVENWLDLLAEYANCIWYIEGSTLYLRPDRPATDGVYPAGQNIVTNGTFDADTNWTKGTGWSITGGYATSDGSQTGTSDLSQSLTVQDGKTYAISFDLIDPSTGKGGISVAGSLSIYFDGVLITSGLNTAGRQGGTGVATGTSATVALRATADFEGWRVDNVVVSEVYHTETDWIEGSLSIEGASQIGTPTQVQLRYSVPSDTAGAWQEDVAIEELAGVTAGTIPVVQTTVYMPGVQNQYEAADKAEARLNRVQNRLRVSYVCADHGIARTPGDVVNLVNATRGIDIYIRVESIDLVAPGRYRITGALYDSTHYPN